MILWVFSLITLVAVLIAAFAGDVRRVTLALWIAGLSVGCIYLTLGAEVLAIIQWILSTLTAISFTFFGVMFGEYGSRASSTGGFAEKYSEKFPEKFYNKFKDKRFFLISRGLLIGVGFAALIWLGAGRIHPNFLMLPEGNSQSGNDIAALGKSLTDNHLLSLEVLALTLFLALIGGGVLARPEAQGEVQS